MPFSSVTNIQFFNLSIYSSIINVATQQLEVVITIFNSDSD